MENELNGSDITESKLYQWLSRHYRPITLIIAFAALGVLIWYALMLKDASINPCGFCEKTWNMVCMDVNQWKP